MNGSNLYKRLIREHPEYCKRKKKKTLIAACEYIETNQTMYQLYLEYDVTPNLISVRYKEIMKLLGVELERKKQNQY